MRKITKLFTIFAILSLVFTGMAFADPGSAPGQDKDPAGYYQHSVTGQVKYFANGHPGDPSQWDYCPSCTGPEPADGAYADASANGYAADPDKSYSRSNWGWGNDTAYAKGNGGGGYDVTAETWGQPFWFFPAFAAADAGGEALGVTDAKTCAWDFGLTSKTYAKVETAGFGSAYGSTLAGSTNVGSAIFGSTYFTGTLEQNNEANETGYALGQGISAGNWSFVAYGNGRDFSDGTTFFGINYEGGYTSGYAMTKGESQVTIDPYGSYRSIFGYTKTCSEFDTNHRGDSAYMAGGGGIGGQVANQYGAFAAGVATFSYSGSTDGANGGASLNANIQKTGSYTRVSSQASSYASTGGGCLNCGGPEKGPVD